MPCNCILTPHIGEFNKIFPEYSNSDKSQLDICKEISKKLKGRILILKGPTTIIISSNNKYYILNDSNSLLSSAGSGDILSGILVGLLSYGYNLDEASLIGTYIHGLCSEIFYKDHSKHKMLAEDILDIIPIAFNEILS